MLECSYVGGYEGPPFHRLFFFPSLLIIFYFSLSLSLFSHPLSPFSSPQDEIFSSRHDPSAHVSCGSFRTQESWWKPSKSNCRSLLQGSKQHCHLFRRSNCGQKGRNHKHRRYQRCFILPGQSRFAGHEIILCLFRFFFRDEMRTRLSFRQREKNAQKDQPARSWLTFLPFEQVSYRSLTTKQDADMTVATIWVPKKIATPTKIFSYQAYEWVENFVVESVPSFRKCPLRRFLQIFSLSVGKAGRINSRQKTLNSHSRDQAKYSPRFFPFTVEQGLYHLGLQSFMGFRKGQRFQQQVRH